MVSPVGSLSVEDDRAVPSPRLEEHVVLDVTEGVVIAVGAGGGVAQTKDLHCMGQHSQLGHREHREEVEVDGLPCPRIWVLFTRLRDKDRGQESLFKTSGSDGV